MAACRGHGSPSAIRASAPSISQHSVGAGGQRALGALDPQQEHAVARPLQRRGFGGAAEHPGRHLGRVGQRARQLQGDRGLRHGVQPQHHLGHHGERAVGAVHDLGHVVARHVLDHVAAGMRDRAVGQHERDADDDIAQRAVDEGGRPGVAGGEQAADRGAVGDPRRVQRHALRVRGQLVVQRASGVPARTATVMSPGLWAITPVSAVVSSTVSTGPSGPAHAAAVPAPAMPSGPVESRTAAATSPRSTGRMTGVLVPLVIVAPLQPLDLARRLQGVGLVLAGPLAAQPRAWGRPCPGCRSRPGRTPCARAA